MKGSEQVQQVELAAGSRGPWSTWVVYAVFLATGLGVVLPGAMLPILLQRWRLSDGQAGLLFFLFFIGSTTGAVLSRGSMPRSIARGCFATVMGLVLLVAASRVFAFAAVLVYGLGLGIAMTSISLSQSRLHPTTRAAQMARLNLVWSIGACLGPALVLRGAVMGGPAAVLLTLAGVFALGGFAVLLLVPSVEATVDGRDVASRTPTLLLLLLVTLATGVESATGGWLATYSKRAGQSLGGVIGAATCFWAGMLISRLIQSHRQLATRSSLPLLAGGPWLMSAALGLLLLFRGGAPISVGALLLGLGSGPMYPLLLALALRRGEGGNAVFVAAGCGASFLPLVTGLVSGWTGSLRAGLSVPLAGAILMGCLGLAAWRKETGRLPG